MNIGQAAEYSGISAKMIRHYEDVGLIGKVARTASGYRVYSENDLHILAFIRRSRNLGFSIEQIGQLLDLWQNKRRTSRKVRELALKHVRDLNVRIEELLEIKQSIMQLVEDCHGDDRADCPIIDGLSDVSQHSEVTAQDRKSGFRDYSSTVSPNFRNGKKE